jgi:hypothetical protein
MSRAKLGAHMQFVGLDEHTQFMRPGGDPVTLDPGLYHVDVAENGKIALTADDGTATVVEAESGGHPLKLEEPFAVAFEPKPGDRRLAVLLPGGIAVVAGSARTPARDAQRQQIFTSSGFAVAVRDLPLKKPLKDVIFNRENLHVFQKFLFGKIEPGTSPTPFAPQTFPPNWVRSVVVTCYVPPAGSYGPGGPGTASGVPVFPPGSEVRRGPYPGYLVSTTPVRVTCPGDEAGKSVELRVTAPVATIGIPTILSMTWQDIYRIVPAANGPVDFPGVIVATGRVPSTPPPPGVSYAGQVQAALDSQTGFGVPVIFDLYLDGTWIGSRKMGYYASYAGGPPPILADQ